jgi:membrane-associated phospholipid phosphatase
MKFLAKIISWLFGPMLLPTYGIIAALWLTTYRFIPDVSRWTVVVVTFLITCALPASIVIWLYRLRLVASPSLTRREDRLVPYLVTLLCYGAEVLYLYCNGADRWLWMFMVAAAGVIAVSAIINLRWKISGHMAGIAGLTALLTRLLVDGLAIVNLVPWVLGAILLCGLIGTCRIALDRHSLGEVVAGLLNGFLWVFFLN